MKKMNKISVKVVAMIIIALAVVGVILSLAGCSMIESKIQELRGDLIGISFDYYEYDSFGNHIMTAHGNKVNLEGVRVVEYGYDSDGSLVKNYTLSSVINITIDKRQHVACGSSLIFVETGLNQVDVEVPEEIYTNSSGFTSLTSVSSWINDIQNSFGCSKVVVIKSSLGYPLAVFQGDKVYWEVCENLPKTTKLSIDGKALYIHRVEYDIIDLDLL